MKKFPVFAGILLIAGVLATMGFSNPLHVQNGVVRSYSPNASLEVRDNGGVQDYTLPQGVTVLPQNASNQLGAGARVTVVAQCYHAGAANRTPGSSKDNVSNDHACVALAVIVRAPANGAIPATGGTGGAAAGTSTPAAGTPGAAGSTAVTATPMICPSPMAAGTPSAGGATGTAVPCVTPTSTP